MPLFKDINQFTPLKDSEVSSDMKLQISATQSVTLGQIAALAKATADNITLTGYNVASKNNTGSVGIKPTDNILEAFQKIMHLFGAGYYDTDSLFHLRGTPVEDGPVSHILTLREWEADNDFNLLNDAVNLRVGIVYGNLANQPDYNDLLTHFNQNGVLSFKGIGWIPTTDTNIRPNRVFYSTTDTGLDTVAFHDSWAKFNIASAVVIASGVTDDTMALIKSAIKPKFLAATGCSRIYCPATLPEAESGTNVSTMIMFQKLGTIGFITVQNVEY